MGVTTAWGSIPRLISLVGHSTASRLLYTAHEIGADEAYALGLVDHVADKGAAVAVALAWAHDIAAGAPGAVAEMKALLRVARAAPRRVARRRTKTLHRDVDRQEHADAIQAYFSRRPSRWPGS